MSALDATLPGRTHMTRADHTAEGELQRELGLHPDYGGGESHPESIIPLWVLTAYDVTSRDLPGRGHVALDLDDITWLLTEALPTAFVQMLGLPPSAKDVLGGHALRPRIVGLVAHHQGKDGVSPIELWRHMGAEDSPASLGVVAYHVRVLHRKGILVACDERRARGAVVHFYRLPYLPRTRATAATAEASA